MKAEEIRRLIINDLFLNMDKDDAEDTLERIDEFVNEVSREVAKKAYNEARNNPPYLDFEDYWLKK